VLATILLPVVERSPLADTIKIVSASSIARAKVLVDVSLTSVITVRRPAILTRIVLVAHSVQPKPAALIRMFACQNVVKRVNNVLHWLSLAPA
jgi:hypothetical protein